MEQIALDLLVLYTVHLDISFQDLHLNYEAQEEKYLTARNSQEISSVIMDMLLCTLEMERLYMQAAEKQELRFLKEQITAVLFV